MLLGVFVTGIVLCMLVYTPWSREPLDILDFSEFLLQLQAGGNLWDSWARLAGYYASQGRVNEVVYGLIAANYHLFGLDPLGWHVVRSVQMLALPAAVYLVLRRYGASRFGSTLGASLFLVGSVPASSWLRQTAEPLGTLFFLAAAALTCGFSEADAPGRRALAIGACVTGMLLSKETLVACLPFLVLSASCWQAHGRFRPFQFDRRTAQVAGACTVAVAVLAGALIWAQTARRPDAYATLYGSTRLADNLWVGRLLPLILPVSFATRQPLEQILFPPNLVFLGMLFVGFVASWRWANRRQIHGKLLVSLTLPVAGLLVYLPWPRFELFYGLPFLVGISLCAGILLGQLGLDSRWKLGLTICWLVLLAGSALIAVGQARYMRARREVNQALALDLSKHSPTDTVIVASAALTPQPWQNPAATLGRYAIATRAAQSIPVLKDVGCDSISALAGQQRRRTTLYVYVDWCGEVGVSDRRIERPFSYFDWYSHSMRPAVVMVDVFEKP
jgi:hypothetical protein